MKTIIYNRISSEGQKTISHLDQKRQLVRYVNENGLSFIVCNRCDGKWIANRLSKEVLKERKHYPKPKCPVCDQKVKNTNVGE